MTSPARSRRNTAPEVRRLLGRLTNADLTRIQIAQRLGISRRALSGWAAGSMRPTTEHLAALHQLADEVDPPIWKAAAWAAQDGQFAPPLRCPTVRPEDIYEQELLWA
jgi:transcriptional regulator with XRE-family HTH domain